MNNCIYEVVKYKTDIRGLWLDNNGKLYRDNIKLYFPKNSNDFDNKVNSLFLRGELAVFVKGKDKAFILENDSVSIAKELSQKIVFDVKKLSHTFIKRLLKTYGGLTIYKQDNSYLIETWKD